jgi:hypothetical protein
VLIIKGRKLGIVEMLFEFFEIEEGEVLIEEPLDI